MRTPDTLIRARGTKTQTRNEHTTGSCASRPSGSRRGRMPTSVALWSAHHDKEALRVLPALPGLVEVRYEGI